MASATSPSPAMKYRFLGNTGLLVSQVSYGTFVTFGTQMDFEQSYSLMARAYQLGINFFDNAETYADGEAEVLMGKIVKTGIERGQWSREDLVLSTKLFFGTKLMSGSSFGPNAIGLSRKHIVEGIKASLKRMDLEYVDLLFCHRPDPYTPVEETVRAMNFAINQGWAFYWGTSEWTSAQVIEACEVADRLGLQRPLFDQTRYNMVDRSRVDYDFNILYEKYGYGVTSFSALASGVLTGKYSKGVPAGSRMSLAHFKPIADKMDATTAKALKLEAIAKEVGCSLPQLGIAWCLANKNVSTVLLGASSLHQLEENVKATSFADNITPDIRAKIDAIVDFKPVLVETQDIVHNMRTKFF